MAVPVTINSLIKLRRGPDADRKNIVFDTGEIVFSTDNKKTFIGDGSTVGGIVVGNHNTFGSLPSPSAVYGDMFYNTLNCVTYLMTAFAGPDNIQNYVRITPSFGSGFNNNNGTITIDNSVLQFVHLSGDTMTGFLTLHSPPVEKMHAANREFVDNGLSSLSSNIINTLNDPNNGFVHLSGDTMIGKLKVDSNFEVTGMSDFKGDVNFNDRLIKRFKPYVKTINLDSTTDSYTIQPSDNGSVIIVKSSAISYIKIPNGLPIGFNVLIVKKSTFTLSFTPESTTGPVDIVNVYGRISIGSPYGVCNMICIDLDQILISGDLV